jgi:hypothetical protein
LLDSSVSRCGGFSCDYCVLAKFNGESGSGYGGGRESYGGFFAEICYLATETLNLVRSLS